MQQTRLRFLHWLVLLMGLFSSLSLRAQHQYQYQGQIGSEAFGLVQFHNPSEVAVDGSGNVYVADFSNNRVQKFDASGQFLLKFGALGSGDGQFRGPVAVFADGTGNVYVTDRSNYRIQKFNASGQFLAKFGALGSGDGQFINPASVAVDGLGNVYVADQNNHRIQKFNASGQFLLKFGSSGTEDGQFQYPAGVALDGSGNVYVADLSNDRIQKFNASGQFLAKFGSRGTTDGKFINPIGVTVDDLGNVYVADYSNNRVQKFNASGQFLTKFGALGSGDGQFVNPAGVALDGSGNVYVADQNNHRIQKFDASGQFLLKFGSSGTGDGQFRSPDGLAVDAAGNVYVADQNNHRVQKFNAAGQFLLKFGSFGTGDGQFRSPDGLAVDAAGNVYVVDKNNNRIQKFNAAGQLLAKFGAGGGGDGQFLDPQGVAVDGSGNVYVADFSNNRVQKFDASGQFLLKFGTVGSRDGQFYYPTGVAVDGAGHVYVADANNNRVQKFDASGQFLLKFGSFGAGDGQFQYPYGLAVDTAGNVYVTDQSNNRVQKFSASGQLLTMFGAGGAGDGEFQYPAGVAVNGAGDVYVADANNYRVQVFSPCPALAFSPSALTGGTVGRAYFQAVSGAPAGYVYSATGLPAGLVISPTGVISGTPAVATASPATVTVSATDGACSGSVTYSLSIAKRSQLITFNTLPARTIGDSPFTLTATASSGLSVSYTSSNPAVATVSGSTVTLVGVGTTTITASQPGDETYQAADDVAQHLVVTATGTNTWNGIGAWTTTGNWSYKSTPGNNSDAVIASGVTTIAGTARVRNLTIRNGARLEIPAGQSLVIWGDLANNGGSITGTGSVQFAKAGTASLTGALLVGGTVQVLSGTTLNTNDHLTLASGAILLHGIGTVNGGGSVVGNITTQRSGKTGGAYNGWSAPVAGVNASVLGSTVYRYDEARPYANHQRWIAAATGGLQPGKGYFAYGAGSPSFTGTANNGTIALPLSYTAAHVAGERGFNLVGNPYPGPISYSALIRANPSINGAVYFWDDDNTGGSGYANSDYAVKTAAGTVSGPNTGTLADDEIASHQGFFVEANAVGSITFTNAMRTGTANTKFFRQQADQTQRLKLSLSGAGKYNETLIAFLADATEGQDRWYDALKLKGNADLSVCSRNTDGDYAIQALPLLARERTLALGVQASKAGAYTFRVNALERVDETFGILLEDKKTGTYYDLRKQASIGLNLEAGSDPARFVLHFTRPASTPATPVAGAPGQIPATRAEPASAAKETVRIFAIGQHIYVRFPDASSKWASAELYSLSGQKMEGFPERALVNGELHLLSQVREKQVYLLRVTTSTGVFTKRVLVGF